jgi:uncharacterized protein (TIGR03492 family)
MTRLLIVSNGNGEAAIADRIAEEVRALEPTVQIDHLALVGVGRSQFMRDVGPQRPMPSGGLIAMGNVANIARDVTSGLIGLTLAQGRFLVRSRGTYARAVAVGDVYALLMTLAAHAPTTYVGTAKSVNVAPYGPIEERLLRRADQIFVRDRATAERLQSHNVDAHAPGNVIVDLFATHDDPAADAAVAEFVPALAIFPGSRDSAYAEAPFLVRVVRGSAQTHPALGAALSVAPQLDPERFITAFESDGWEVLRRSNPQMPFSLVDGGRTIIHVWRGPIGPLLSRVQLVIGQAGTANEAAAAAGVPVVAFELGSDRKTAWYRMRQHGLLGDSLAVVPGVLPEAVSAVNALLDDAPQRVHMAQVGRERMGAPGGALAIARAIAGTISR